jgi:hypothetical protein
LVSDTLPLDEVVQIPIEVNQHSTGRTQMGKIFINPTLEVSTGKARLRLERKLDRMRVSSGQLNVVGREPRRRRKVADDQGRIRSNNLGPGCKCVEDAATLPKSTDGVPPGPFLKSALWMADTKLFYPAPRCTHV